MEERIIERHQGNRKNKDFLDDKKKYDEKDELVSISEQISENDECHKVNGLTDFMKRKIRQDKRDHEIIGSVVYNDDINYKELMVKKRNSSCYICMYKNLKNVSSALYEIIADELCNYIATNDFNGDTKVLYEYINQKKQILDDSIVLVENVFDYLFILKKNDYVFCSGFDIVEDLNSFKLSIEGELLAVVSTSVSKSNFKKNSNWVLVYILGLCILVITFGLFSKKKSNSLKIPTSNNFDLSKHILRPLQSDNKVLEDVNVKESDADGESVISEVVSAKKEELKNVVQSQDEAYYLDSAKTYENVRTEGVNALNNREYEMALNHFYSAKKYSLDGDDLDSLIEKCNIAIKKIEKLGDSLYTIQKYDDALEQYEKLINVQTTASYKIGNCYLYKNQYDIASDYYNKSIASGNMQGAYSLANLYRQGLLNSASIYTTEQLYLMAAHAGNYNAMDSVALDYERIKNFTEAVFWFNKTVQIHSFSQYKLACYYFDGVGGLEVNPSKGMELLKKSAIQNYLPALYYLGIIYDNGAYGVGKNVENQKFGISLIRYAAILGYEPAKKTVDEIKSVKL